MIIFLKIISYWFSNLHWVLLKSCAWPSVSAWSSVYAMIHFFQLISNIFSIVLRTWLAFPHPSNPWFIILHLYLTFGPHGNPPSLLHHSGEWTSSHDTMSDAFASRMQDFMFTWIDSRPFIAYLLVFTLMGWHCDFGGWYLDVGWHCHHWPYLSIFDFMGNFILWGCCNSHGLS